MSGIRGHLNRLLNVISLTRQAAVPVEQAKDMMSDLAGLLHGTGVKDTRPKKTKSRRTRPPRPPPPLDGTGVGAVPKGQLTWHTYEVEPGADLLPSSRAGAAAWLSRAFHTEDNRTAVAWSNSTTIVRRCTTHAPVLRDGVWHACGCAYRMDAKDGWVPKKRMADANWDGCHICEDGKHPVADGAQRRNSPFSVAVEAELSNQLYLGAKPKALWIAACQAKWRRMSFDQKTRTHGREAWEAVLGYSLSSIQAFSARGRLQKNNGYNVEDLADLQAS
jgi:hypothetical protein